MTTPGKLFDSGRRRLLLFTAAAAIVIVGAWLRPARTPRTQDAPQEAPAPMLRTIVEEREPIRIFRALRARADEVAPTVARLECDAPPAPPAVPDWSGMPVPKPELPRFGALVAPGEVLVDAGSREDRPCVIRFGGTESYPVEALPKGGTGLAVIRISGAARDAARLAPAPPVAGQIVFVTGATPSGTVISPVFVVQADAASLTLSARPAAVASGPLFDSDARLTGFLQADGTSLPIAEALARARQPSPRSAPPLSLGIRTQALTEPLRPFFGEEGVIVADVAPGGPSSEAGLRPGDVLVAIAGTPVRSPADVAQRLASVPAGPLEITFRRGARQRRVTVEAERVKAEPREAVAPSAGAIATRRILPIDDLPSRRAGQSRGETPPDLLYVEEAGVRFFTIRDAGR